jgi:hypothetical protein
MKKFVSRALILAGCAAVVATLVTRPAIAQGPLKPVLALIVNDAQNPVPVAVQGTLDVAPAPLWPGTPFLDAEVVINRDAGGFEQCAPLFTAEAGTAVILKTLTGRFSVPPGTFGSLRARVTVPGGQPTSVTVPSHRSAPVLQVAGLYDGFQGSVDMGGIPVVAVEYCQSGVDAAGTMTAIGFTVPLPQ